MVEIVLPANAPSLFHLGRAVGHVIDRVIAAGLGRIESRLKLFSKLRHQKSEVDGVQESAAVLR